MGDGEQILIAFDNGCFWTLTMMTSIFYLLWHLVILLMACEYGNLYVVFVR